MNKLKSLLFSNAPSMSYKAITLLLLGLFMTLGATAQEIIRVTGKVLDGTMEKSPVWLNRFARLSSNGGKFQAGIKADYGSEILPGGENNVGTITASTIELGFGARVIFDVNGNETDRLVADNISIEKKDWTNGPEYSAPVFVFTSQRNQLKPPIDPKLI